VSTASTRLAKLEAIAPRGCPVCRYWSIAIVNDHDEPDRPTVCPGCHRRVAIMAIIRLGGVDVADI